MKQETTKSLFIFTLPSTIYLIINIYVYTMFSTHINENGGLIGDYVLMYFALALIFVSIGLGLLNYRIRDVMGNVAKKIALLNIVGVTLIGLIFLTSLVSSHL